MSTRGLLSSGPPTRGLGAVKPDRATLRLGARASSRQLQQTPQPAGCRLDASTTLDLASPRPSGLQLEPRLVPPCARSTRVGGVRLGDGGAGRGTAPPPRSCSGRHCGSLSTYGVVRPVDRPSWSERPSRHPRPGLQGQRRQRQSSLTATLSATPGGRGSIVDIRRVTGGSNLG